MSKSRTIAAGRLAAMLKAVSNPSRLRILVRIAEACAPGAACCPADAAGRCVGEVAKGLGLAPSTVSHHLKELRSAGVIEMERRGQRIECSVDPDALRELGGFFSGLVPGRAGAKRRRRPPP